MTIVHGSGAPTPEAIRVRVFDGGGLLYGFTDFVAQPPSEDGHLGTVVVYPARGGDSSVRIPGAGSAARDPNLRRHGRGHGLLRPAGDGRAHPERRAPRGSR